MEAMPLSYIPGEPILIANIVWELKTQGIFDNFRKECIADVDTKPAYQNLRQRVEGSVSSFLKRQKWSSDLNKNQLREQLRKSIHESGYLETGVERIVDQVVNPKMNTVFLPKVTDVVYQYLGLSKPDTKTDKEKEDELKSKSEELLPKELEAVSPESRIDEKNEDSNLSLESMKIDEDESPPFEPLVEDNSVDSHLSGMSGLQSHDDSNSSLKALQIDDTQMSKHSSDGNNVDVEVKMEVDNSQSIQCQDNNSKGFEGDSNSSSFKTEFKKEVSDVKADDVDVKVEIKEEQEQKEREKEKHRSDSKSRSRTESKTDKGDRKHDHVKDKYRDKDNKDKGREREKGRNEKDKYKSSSHRHSGDRKKDDRKDRERDSSSKREKDKDSSSKDRGDGGSHRSSSSKSRDDKSRSRSDSHRDRKSSSSRSDKDKDKERRDKQHKDKKDDHYSSKHKSGDRRSNDRDSNDGSGVKGSSGSNGDSLSSLQRVQKESSNSNDSGNSGNSSKSDNKYKSSSSSTKHRHSKYGHDSKSHTKHDKNEKEATSSKHPEKSEQIASDISDSVLTTEQNESPRNIFGSAAAWEALESKCNSSAELSYFDGDGDDEDYEEMEQIVSVPKSYDDSFEYSNEKKIFQYFTQTEIKANETSLSNSIKYIVKLQKQIEKAESILELPKIAQNDLNKENKNVGHLKRKNGHPLLQSPVKKNRNNNVVEKLPVINHTNFNLPLSPAESDSDKSTDKKPDHETPPVPVSRRNKIVSSQRYSSEDLYKPRPVITRTTNRRRGNVDN